MNAQCALLCATLLCFASERQFWLQKTQKPALGIADAHRHSARGVGPPPCAVSPLCTSFAAQPAKKQRFRQISAAVAFRGTIPANWPSFWLRGFPVICLRRARKHGFNAVFFVFLLLFSSRYHGGIFLLFIPGDRHGELDAGA